MASLVEEIQRDALDPTIRTATLLRKVKLAAAKLQLPAVEEWVDKELNGYNGSPVPNYRQMRGIPKAFNPYNGWIPIMVDPKSMAIISRVHDGQSVAAIEDLLNNEQGSFYMPLSHELIHELNKGAHVTLGQMGNFISRGVLVSILDQVRNMVLDWAIELEKSGIKGEGMSFKPEEKTVAQNNPAINIGSVETLVGVVGNHNQVRDIVNGSINIEKVSAIADELNKHYDVLVQDGADGDALRIAVEGILSETQKGSPNSGTLRGLLSDARSALSGAAGSLLATGALSLINSAI